MSREERLAGVVKACREHEPTPVELKRSIMHSFSVTEETARDYIESLRETGRIVLEGEVLVPGRNGEGNGASVEPVDGGLVGRVEALEARVAELEDRLEVEP